MSAWSWVKNLFSFADGQTTTSDGDDIPDELQYCVVTGTSIAALEAAVNLKIQAGWLPSGSICQGFELAGNGPATMVYRQALIFSGNPIVV